jgi:hypothetical protein
MLLPVAVASSDALLDPLRVPGQVVVDDQRAELEVDALGGGFGGERIVASSRKCSISAVRTSIARDPEARPVSLFFAQPLIDLRGSGPPLVPLNTPPVPCSRALQEAFR